MLDVIGFGALNYDKLYRVQSFVRPGEHGRILEASEAPGGSAANTIYGLAKLGKRTGFLGAIGRDEEGKAVLESFLQAGVDTSHISIKPNSKTGIIVGLVDLKGERVLYPSPGANDLLSEEDLDISYLRETEFLHLSSFVNEEQLKLQLRAAKELGEEVKISFSPGVYADLGIEAISELLRRSSVIFLNSQEAEKLGGDWRKLGMLLSKRSLVAVTLGEKGCCVFERRRAKSFPVFLAKQVVDTTGAGDAFAAGFLYGLLEGFRTESCAAIGSFLAARVIEHLGARKGFPSKAEVDEFLRGL